MEEVDESGLVPFGDVDAIRTSILDRAKGAFEKKFPLDDGNVRIELGNLRYDEKKAHYGPSALKKAVMEGGRLSVPLRGDFRMLDARTGEVLDERKNHLVANVPYLTERGTFVNNGNEYSVSNQTRLRPGVYSRRKENGELEAHVNPRPGTGPSMRVFMEPETGVFRAMLGDSRIRLYPVLRSLGVADEDLKARWGEKVWKTNQSSDDKAFQKFFDKLVGTRAERFRQRLEAAAMADDGESRDPEPEDEGDGGPSMKAASMVVVPGGSRDFEVRGKALRSARSRTDTSPSEAMARAGNYRKGRVRIHGMEISIENPKGSTRSGTSPDGKKWSVRMKNDYGYIRGTRGADGDHVDVFLGPRLESEVAFVVDQFNPDGSFDEHKAVLGAVNSDEAREIYLANYGDGWECGPVTPMSVPYFRKWLASGPRNKPASGRSVKRASVAVDLDGTLAESEEGPFDPRRIGPPVEEMVDRVKEWLSEGREVVVFTARADDPENIPAVRGWLEENGLGGLEVTNRKRPDMEQFWDDRAVPVSENEGTVQTGEELSRKAAASRAVDMLSTAKAESDRGNYGMKHQILRALMSEVPGEFGIDSEDRGIVGVTHLPSGFRMHLPRKVVPGTISRLEGVGDASGASRKAAASASEWRPAPLPSGRGDRISGERAEIVREQLGRMEIDPEISMRNLGREHSNFGPDAILDTTEKLLRINRGEADVDDRDDKANQTLHSVDDFIEERVMKDAGQIGRTLLYRSRYNGSLKALKSGHFTPQIESLIVGNSLSQAVGGVNPVELWDMRFKVTQVGEGGIGSADSIPVDARNVHPSQLGMVDVVRTPESGSVGVDQRLVSLARKGPNNQVYIPFLDRKTKKRVWRTPSQVYGRRILFPRFSASPPGKG